MYDIGTDGNDRCRCIAWKLIYYVAVFSCTGGAMDALGMQHMIRAATAKTAPFMARPAQSAMVGRMPGHTLDADEKAEATPAIPSAAAPQTPGPAASFRLASIDTRSHDGLSALAMRPPAAYESEDDAIPTVPFEGKTRPERTPLVPGPGAAIPLAPGPNATVRLAPDVPAATPAPLRQFGVARSEEVIALPKITDMLPRPRPPLTPAQELGLEGKERERAEKCLSTAIYFEARNEPVRGQIAVAQVVLNRVFSPYYPGDVCGVVYQNAHRRLACQFTFACDGIPDVVRERGPWLRAQRIAKQALDAQVWLPDVAKSTHYHATYVRPKWIREMRVMVRHGQHIFYRPHRWGDGSDEAGWGVASLTHHLPAQRTKISRN